MPRKYTAKLSRFYNEHSNSCTNCGYLFKDEDRTHLGYLSNGNPAVLCDNCTHLLKDAVVNHIWKAPEYEAPLPNETLWRYMDLAKFISLLEHKSLYFAAANTFEDRFEGAKGIVERKEKWDVFYKKFFIEAMLTCPVEPKEEWTPEKLEKESERLLYEMNSSGEKDRQFTFINCWHLNEHESEAMWKLYSKDITNAIAIRTTVKDLKESFGNNYFPIGKVKYIDYEKEFASINGAFWYKRKSFEYEKEVRVITRRHNIKEHGLYIPVDLMKLIKGVYISPYAPEWFVDVVKTVLRKYRLNIQISYSKLLEKPFF